MGRKHLFRFKQFSLTDDGCAMKIGTDGVLLGASAARYANESSPAAVLDIGTGSGLLALMIAQKCDGFIDTIDMDGSACSTAFENFRQSPWAGRFRVYDVSLQEFRPGENGVYDLIVCNPPYFENSHKSNSKARNLARHNDSLHPSELFFHAARLLKPSGRTFIIYPAIQHNVLIEMAGKNGLTETGRLNISADRISKPRRIISEFVSLNTQISAPSNHKDENGDNFYNYIPGAPTESHLAIETGKRHGFTEEYRLLTFDYHPFF